MWPCPWHTWNPNLPEGVPYTFHLSRKLHDPRFCESSGHCLFVTGPTQLGLIPRNKKKHDEEPDQTEMTNFQGHVSGELHPLGSRLTHPLLCQESSKITDTRYCDDTVGTHPRWSRVWHTAILEDSPWWIPHVFVGTYCDTTSGSSTQKSNVSLSHKHNESLKWISVTHIYTVWVYTYVSVSSLPHSSLLYQSIYLSIERLRVINTTSFSSFWKVF